MEPGQETDDELIAVLPIHFTNILAPNVQLHQFPLLNRPLEVPPSAEASGKKITARIKPEVRRMEFHIPADTRPEVWNRDKSRDLGVAQMEDDIEKKQEQKKLKEGEEPRLNGTRLQSEQIPQRGIQMLGVIRNGFDSFSCRFPEAHSFNLLGKLNLHPIGETHQFRPTVTYLDTLSRRNRRGRQGGSSSDSEDGPPLDPDDPTPVEASRREKKAAGPGKEVQVSARKADDKGGISAPGSLSAVRREMLRAIRLEEDEEWNELEFYNFTVRCILLRATSSH
jgi:DNA-directed RNA polymerase-3 subunit RPC5